jgi:hypothetical protein
MAIVDQPPVDGPLLVPRPLEAEMLGQLAVDGVGILLRRLGRDADSSVEGVFA